ncbi:MAG: hypothetical protein CM1200mP39_06430 [Dehalococcoidia bacterium]|nr:MAG: hypothetical protein CM1200mP39_06430 [Dehalococcoidia bacterium]
MIAEESSVQGEKLLALNQQVNIPGSGWIAARAVSDLVAWHVWPVNFAAHTSPVYVKAGDANVFDVALGEYLITTMQGGVDWLDTLATRGDDERQKTIRKVFTDAIGKSKRKFHINTVMDQCTATNPPFSKLFDTSHTGS